jgi:hypothetical protein
MRIAAVLENANALTAIPAKLTENIKRSLMRPIFLGFGLSFLLAGCGIGNNTATLPPCAATDCNCSDFATQAEAQRVFDAFPDDVHRLDGDGNGIACESLPRGSGETTAATDGMRSQLLSEHGDTVAYEYDDENSRVSSTVNGVKTTYLVDSNRPYASPFRVRNALEGYKLT